MIRCLILCIAILALAAIEADANPADNTSFTVSPMTTEVSLTPGTQQTQVLVVKDDTPPGTMGAPLRLKIYATDWTLARDGSPRFAAPGTLPGSCSAWIQVNPPEITLLPGQTQTVRYTVSVPTEGHGTTHTMVMFEAAPQPMNSRNGMVAVSGRIGASLYVSAGPQARRARITALAAGPKTAMLTVENTGSALLRLQGKLTLYGTDGKPVATATMSPVVLLPGADGVRDISLDMPPLPIGTVASSVTVLLDYGGDVLLGAHAPIQVR